MKGKIDNKDEKLKNLKEHVAAINAELVSDRSALIEKFYQLGSYINATYGEKGIERAIKEAGPLFIDELKNIPLKELKMAKGEFFALYQARLVVISEFISEDADEVARIQDVFARLNLSLSVYCAALQLDEDEEMINQYSESKEMRYKKDMVKLYNNLDINQEISGKFKSLFELKNDLITDLRNINPKDSAEKKLISDLIQAIDEDKNNLEYEIMREDTLFNTVSKLEQKIQTVLEKYSEDRIKKMSDKNNSNFSTIKNLVATFLKKVRDFCMSWNSSEKIVAKQPDSLEEKAKKSQVKNLLSQFSGGLFSLKIKNEDDSKAPEPALKDNKNMPN